MKKLFILFCLFLMSCGVRQKSVHSFTEKVDSTFTQIKKETKQEVKDSVKTSSNIEIKEDSSSLNIVFSDTTKSTDPVVIEYDTVGRLIIHSGGRIIKSISTTKKKKRAVFGLDSAHVLNTSNIVKSDSANIDLHKQTRVVSSKKFTFQLPWFAYLIFIICIGLVWFFWKQISAARKVSNTIFPYSSPNDKS